MRFKKDIGAIVRKSGVSFRVWAPFADSVSVTGSFNEWGETPLKNEEDGYWHAIIHGATAGQEYKFIIKNGDKTLVKNDPRARAVATSAGNSLIVDNDFEWMDDESPRIPRNRQIVYELHVGTFNRPDESTKGTFRTAMERLDYLKELGVTTIELMPIHSMSTVRAWWGYTPDYLYAVESQYGGRHQLMEFVKAAHKRGMMVILDVVYNHMGPDKNLDIWQFDGWNENDKGGIYFYNDFRSKTPWGETRLDYGRPEVRQYILDNIKMWLVECHIDGLRVDSTIYIRNHIGRNDDPSNDLSDGWSLLQDINNISKKINYNNLVIAEDIGWNDFIVKPTDEGGAGFGSQWEVNFHESLKEALIVNSNSEINLTGLCNHLSHRYNNDAYARVIYVDSHDSAANGSARFNHLLSPKHPGSRKAREKSLIAAAITMTAPGIPMLLQGQEFLEPGSFSDWQGLNWENANKNSGIISAYRALTSLRKNDTQNVAGLSGQGMNLIHVDENNKVMAYHRWDKGGPKDDTLVIINFADKKHDIYEIGFPRNGLWQVRFNSTSKIFGEDFKNIEIPEINVFNGSGNIVLPPECVVILSQDK